MPFLLLSTSRFERDYKRLAKRTPKVLTHVEAMVEALREDPYNQSGFHNIKKLKGLKQGEGQWRIASGDFRIRYDLFDKEVLLYSCKPRREAYRE